MYKNIDTAYCAAFIKPTQMSCYFAEKCRIPTKIYPLRYDVVCFFVTTTYTLGYVLLNY